MPDKAKLQAINEQKERDERLIELSKSGFTNAAEVRLALSGGANVHAKGSRAMLNACKKLNYDVIHTLIEFGALSMPIARKYLGSLCDYRGFDKSDIEAYYNVLDVAISITGRDDDYFEPYINNRAAVGDMEGLDKFKRRFELSDDYIVRHIYPGIIFEIIKNGHEDMLAYITNNRDWIDKSCFDSAVAGGEEAVLQYIFEHSELITPSRAAVATALFAGRTGVLDMLSDVGYDFEEHDSFFLEKACRATMSTGFAPLEYLLSHGYKLTDSYKGKTIMENALADGNFKLTQYVRERT